MVVIIFCVVITIVLVIRSLNLLLIGIVVVSILDVISCVVSTFISEFVFKIEIVVDGDNVLLIVDSDVSIVVVVMMLIVVLKTVVLGKTSVDNIVFEAVVVEIEVTVVLIVVISVFIVTEVVFSVLVCL